VEAQAAPVGAEAHLPRCWRGYSHLETRRVGGREYLYAVHESRAGGQRTREFRYLGPRDGYAAGLVAHSWRGAPWLGLSAMGATRDEEFRRLEYLGEVVRAALDAAAAEEDLGWIPGALDDARRTVSDPPQFRGTLDPVAGCIVHNEDCTTYRWP